MNVGKKIKYFRTKAGLTQSQLATASGIHLVSIKKYETNKMQPQLPQIERIAAALNIGTNALLDFGNFRLSCETVGDFMGIIIMLCNSKILRIDGEREENGFLDPKTVSLRFEKSFLFKNLLKLCSTNGDAENNQITPDVLSIQITSSIVLSELIKFERIHYLYDKVLSSKGNVPDDEFEQAVNQIQVTKEKVELELQRSMVIINSESKGISVKINS